MTTGIQCNVDPRCTVPAPAGRRMTAAARTVEKMYGTGRREDPAAGSPPTGTAAVRPQRHIEAVRGACEGDVGDLRSAGFGWVLGETAAAPITGTIAGRPPTLDDVETEILMIRVAAADIRDWRERDRQHDAERVLAWLIGWADEPPCGAPETRGGLVGGWGQVVRSPQEIHDLLGRVSVALREEGDFWQEHAGAEGHDGRKASFGHDDVVYLSGVEEVLAYALHRAGLFNQARRGPDEQTHRGLVGFSQRAGHAIEGRNPETLFRAEGQSFAVQWLLGDSPTPPADLDGHGPYWWGSELPAMRRAQWDRDHAGWPRDGALAEG